MTETLTMRRHIRAAQADVFAAWTEPDQLVRWWGPPNVECITAEVDLRVGGRFRLGNRLPDGQVVWISGSYELVEPPRRLRHTWVVDSPAGQEESSVTVDFEARDDGTDIVITHERIATPEIRAGHEVGWRGCLDGLENHLAS